MITTLEIVKSNGADATILQQERTRDYVDYINGELCDPAHVPVALAVSRDIAVAGIFLPISGQDNKSCDYLSCFLIAETSVQGWITWTLNINPVFQTTFLQSVLLSLTSARKGRVEHCINSSTNCLSLLVDLAYLVCLGETFAVHPYRFISCRFALNLINTHSMQLIIPWNDTRVLRTGLPVSWIMMAPSVTPNGGGGPNNPGLRLYKFETNTGQVRSGAGGAAMARAYILDNISTYP